MKEYLAIFDIDGTLFDTRGVNYYSYKEALKRYGIDLDKNYFMEKCFGRHYNVFLPEIVKTPEDVEPIHELKMEVYKKFLDKAKINSHLFRIIKNIREDYYIAVVTTASRKNMMDLLRHFGYQDFFDYAVTQENIRKKKPDPEGFLTVMDHFGISETNTIIFEDSEIGIAAARATGSTVIIVDGF